VFQKELGSEHSYVLDKTFWNEIFFRSSSNYNVSYLLVIAVVGCNKGETHDTILSFYSIVGVEV